MLKVHIVHEEAAKVKGLRRELDKIRDELVEVRRRYQALEVKYGYEIHVNSELIDLCRLHGIKYRPGLDIANWDKDFCASL